MFLLSFLLLYCFALFRLAESPVTTIDCRPGSSAALLSLLFWPALLSLTISARVRTIPMSAFLAFEYSFWRLSVILTTSKLYLPCISNLPGQVLKKLSDETVNECHSSR
ncbi:hypothetical protein BDV34DRAFT_196754 [Aspergillus parasiticus]|uniref:Secreted protein n=1 Tax=Aspergillus parasiticus TaxID=5067 RepID=A0A5N6DIB7_ASPPA|nr:hypothetical protein BDV34DRAFT_196754 [Aspergillus parasiticus]